MSAPLPRSVTVLDLVKTLAVTLMIIDHIGFYLLPSAATTGDPVLWWRVLGRFCVPIWFFLLGFAATRTVPPAWWIGAALVTLSSLIGGLWLLPLNILATMIAIRLILPAVTTAINTSKITLFGIILVIFPLAYPTFFVVEYGALGLGVALFGAAVRAQNPRHIWILGVSSWILLVLVQSIFFHFSPAQSQTMMIGTGLVLYALTFLKPGQMGPPNLPLSPIIQWIGRHTLEIYVIHLILFRALAWAMGWGDGLYGFGAWEWGIWQSYSAR